MPSSCCVPLCNGNKRNGPKVSIFRFPADEELLRKWLRIIQRKDFYPRKSSRICELHFKETDFVREASAYDEKTGRTITAPLAVKRLQVTAIPSVFPNYTNSNISKPAKYLENGKIGKEVLDLRTGKSETIQTFLTNKKFHTHIYPFRCDGCTYATRYCHSFKMHLWKYNHLPGKTLNPDGTLKANSDIDYHGRIRGSEINQPSTSAVIIPSFQNSSYELALPSIKSQEGFGQHILMHGTTTDNPDLMMQYNLSSDVVSQMQAERPFRFNNYPVNRRPYTDNAQRSKNLEAPTTAYVNLYMNGSPRNNGNQYSGSMHRTRYSSYSQRSISPNVFSSNIYNNNQIHLPVDLSINCNSTDSELRNWTSTESGNDSEALELSLKSICSVPMTEAERLEDASTSAANSNSSEQYGHFKPSIRNRRKGKPFKLDHYLKGNDTPPASPSQD